MGWGPGYVTIEGAAFMVTLMRTPCVHWEPWYDRDDTVLGDGDTMVVRMVVSLPVCTSRVSPCMLPCGSIYLHPYIPTSCGPQIHGMVEWRNGGMDVPRILGVMVLGICTSMVILIGA